MRYKVHRKIKMCAIISFNKVMSIDILSFYTAIFMWSKQISNTINKLIYIYCFCNNTFNDYYLIDFCSIFAISFGVQTYMYKYSQKMFFFLALLNGQEARNIIDQLVTFLSSDTSEAKCESECHTLIANPQSTLQHLCPFMCHL